MPKRIQRRRVKGWRLPEGAVIVTRPGKWGNPWRVHKGRDPSEAVGMYDIWLTETVEGGRIANAARRELRGHDLACWCREGKVCHGDVLLRIANEAEG